MIDIIKKTGLNNGLILGFLLILLSSYIHFYNIDLLVNVWFGVTTLLLTVIFGIISISVCKSNFNGQITFKEAFSTYFVTILVGNILSFLFLIVLYYGILSPETKETIKQTMIDFNINLMKQNLAPTKTIDEAVAMYQKFDPFAFSEVFTASVKYLLRDCLIGLLVALIFRNKRTI